VAELELLQDDDVTARSGQLVRRRKAHDPGADDGDLGVLGHAQILADDLETNGTERDPLPVTTGAARPVAAELFSRPGFAPAFAAFLRHNRDWRRRRIDRLMPLDRDLASRTINLQGVVDAGLLRAFLTGRGRDLGLAEAKVEDGDTVTAWIPAISQGKRLLLDYSVRDGRGQSLAMLSRMEAARAVGHDLLGTLVGGIPCARKAELAQAIADLAEVDPGKRDAVREARQSAFRSIYVLLVTLAFHYPFALHQRLEDWENPDGADGDSEVRDESLETWIRREGDFFRQGLGEHLVEKLTPLLPLRDRLELPRPSGVASGRRFTSIPVLLLYAVRDLLETVVALSQTPSGRLQANVSNAQDLATQAGTHAVYGVRLLETMLDLQADKDGEGMSLAHEAVMTALERWTAYFVMDIRLGVPFQIKVSETLLLDAPVQLRSRLKPQALRGTLGEIREALRAQSLQSGLAPAALKTSARGLWRQYHPLTAIQRYPLAIGDADIYHVEVKSDDPEFRCADPGIFDEGREDQKRRPVTDVFPTRQTASGRLVHLYATRRRELKHGRVAEGPPPLLEVRFPITLSVVVGYAGAAVALLVAGIYTFKVWGDAILSGTPPSDFRSLAAVGALAVTLSLWLTKIQNPRPIVHRKLWWAHWTFYGALLLIIVPAGVYAARWLVADLFG
jgi:hypothetical protein